MAEIADKRGLGVTTGWVFHSLEDGERTAIVFSVRNGAPVVVALDNESLGELSRELRRHHVSNREKLRGHGKLFLS